MGNRTSQGSTIAKENTIQIDDYFFFTSAIFQTSSYSVFYNPTATSSCVFVSVLMVRPFLPRVFREESILASRILREEP
jgi:hypothetical protein